MKFKKTIAVASITLIGLALAACGRNDNRSTSSKQTTLHLMQAGELMSLDTAKQANLNEFNTLTNSMEGLYRSNKKNELVPAMATKVVKPTDGGKLYIYHLRKDAKWSNGDPVTAQDFVKSWQRSVDPSAQAGYGYIFRGIKNADDIIAGKKKPSALGVKALNSKTLQVQLDYPMPYFNKMQLLPIFFPQSSTALKKFGDQYGSASNKMYYNGAFKIKDWTGSNLSWNLVRNTHYYDKKEIKLNKITMQVVKDPNTAHQLFQDKNLDDATITGTTAQGLQKNKNLYHFHRAGVYYLRLNLRKNRPLRNEKLRKAIGLVLNKKHLASKVLSDGSVSAETFVAPGLAKDPTTGKDFSVENKPQETYNVAKAKRLWKQGLKEINQKKVNLKYDTDDQTVSKNVAQFVQSQVEENLPNANVEIHAVPTKNVQTDLAKGNFDMNYGFWFADFADPISDLNVLQSDNVSNYGKYNSPQYDKYLNAARTQNATNPRKYWNNMSSAQQQLNKDMPVIPLYTMTESHLVNPNLKGVLWHPVGEVDYTRAYFIK